MNIRKCIVGAVLALALAAGVAPASPVEARAPAEASSIDCNGDLSPAEATALNAFPVAETTAAMLCDVRASDLPSLDPDLRTKLRTPVRVVESTTGTRDGAAASEAAGACEPGVPGCWRRSGHEHRWRVENVTGAVLMRFKHVMSWSWNYNEVRRPEDWWEGSASAWWGWTYCGVNPQYHLWGPGHRYMNLVVRGEYGAIWPAGCSVILNRLGGYHRVHRDGRVTLVNNWCGGNCTSTGTGGPG